ncbi:nephrocystin-1 [Austrofundulus limnaeus]|uniref:Nephrocystin-1 n=1 Tax=Austrofundulus limnaeus TaxID=52670 RepID=A0A2I4DAI8_AUSLI|nr:PREDICTED: nephrocystin-1 [Austrofundulus limnaeus]
MAFIQRLQLVQREADVVERKVDRLVKDVNNTHGSKEELFRRCRELQISAEKTLKALQTLAKADDRAPEEDMRYDRKKQAEERRLKKMLERLNTLSLELSPPGPSAAADNISKEDSEDDGDGNSGDNNSSDDDDDDDDETDGKDEDRAPSSSQFYMVLNDLEGEQEGDLSIQRGEVLRIIKKTSDGWWLAQNTKGYRGVVPKTFLKLDSEIDDEDEEDTEDEDENDEDEEEEEDEVEEKPSDDQGKDSKVSNWSTVRKALTQIDTTDVLSAMGAIPSGFRSSTLSKLLEEDVHFKCSHYVQPELSGSQLSFKDLSLDTDTGRVRSRQVRTCVCFTLWSCRMIPSPGVGLQVLSRHIRLCAFDGTQVLSNIHTVRASYNSKNPKTWTFSPMMSGILPTLLDGDCFLRSDSLSPNLGILFELGVSFLRKSTGERGELSCGWAFLKLTDDTGNPIPNKTYELQVNGGTPYEKDVIVETSTNRKSVFQQMLQGKQQPKLNVKLKSTNSRTRAQLSLLPDTLLYCLNCVHLLVLHRQLLADTLLIDRPTMQNADPISSPILSTFPALLDQTDLLDALRISWMEAETNMSRAQKRDLTYLKQEFSKVYMSVYFLLNSPSLPCYRWADPPSEEQRARVIYAALEDLKKYQHTARQSGGPEIFFDSDHSHFAFDVQECTFDLLNAAR